MSSTTVLILYHGWFLNNSQPTHPVPDMVRARVVGKVPRYWEYLSRFCPQPPTPLSSTEGAERACVVLGKAAQHYHVTLLVLSLHHYCPRVSVNGRQKL